MTEQRPPRWSDSRMQSLEKIYSYLDGEMNDEALTAIEQHLRGCPECEREYRIEALLKELVRRSCCHDTAPAGLAEKIRARITVERTSFYVMRDQ